MNMISIHYTNNYQQTLRQGCFDGLYGKRGKDIMWIPEAPSHFIEYHRARVSRIHMLSISMRSPYRYVYHAYIKLHLICYTYHVRQAGSVNRGNILVKVQTVQP